MNRITLIYIALIALAVSAIPNVATLFANQHTFYSSANISCLTCHSDIKNQLELPNYVNLKHKEAGLNYNYTTYFTIGGISYDKSSRNITVNGGHIWNWNGSVWINSSNTGQYMNESLDKNGNGAMDGDEICMLCHSRSLLGIEAHAGTAIVSSCDDDRCHGNRMYMYNDPSLLGINSNITAAGYNISVDNIHSEYYLTTSNQSSPYDAYPLFGYTHGNVNGSYISRGYYTCMGCHSDVNVDINLILPPTYEHDNISMKKGRYQ
ncbi:MAG: hypothetical protein OIN88_14810 [Candidatus Methanoperedens sp.]|nr:hypothetical protein [Candidatus Methanoperedens sp.]